MLDPSLALQRMIRARLIETGAVTALVPPDHIREAPGLPERLPCILFGEAQVIPDHLTLARREVRVAFDLHIWTEASRTSARSISWSVVEALKPALPITAGWRVIDMKISTRSVPDPEGRHGHVVATVDALVEEA